jgi:hypothetical protein
MTKKGRANGKKGEGCVVKQAFASAIASADKARINVAFCRRSLLRCLRDTTTACGKLAHNVNKSAARYGAGLECVK